MFAWLAPFIERRPNLHRFSLLVWRLFPPRLAGFLKGLLARKWLVGAVAVMIDESTSPFEVLLVEHSYRPRGAWGLPGGSLESTPGDPTRPRNDTSSDDVIESALRREILEELGIEIAVLGLLRIDAIPYIAEEPGPYRLDFYYRCAPRDGFAALRQSLSSGQTKPCSPEITQIRFVPLTDLTKYDLFSSDVRILLKAQRQAPPPDTSSTETGHNVLASAETVETDAAAAPCSAHLAPGPADDQNTRIDRA
jgi:8-oxo-dGTP pyrophosphatase MutT (NUDIX family)